MHGPNFSYKLTALNNDNIYCIVHLKIYTTMIDNFNFLMQYNILINTLRINNFRPKWPIIYGIQVHMY